MANERPTNTIKVELDLLRNQNLDLLKAFGDKFAISVTSLAEAIENAGLSISGGGGERFTGGPSSHASRVDDAHRLNRINRVDSGEGGGTRFTGGGGGGGDDSTRSSASIASGGIPLRSRLGAYGFDQPTMTEWERGSFSLGNIPVGTLGSMRYGSHVMQKIGQQWAPLELKDANDPTKGVQYQAGASRAGMLVSEAGGAVGAAARAGTYAQGLYRDIAQPIMGGFGTAPRQQGQTALYGVNVGDYGGGGIGGLPFGSQAWKTGVGAEWQAFKASRWGGEDAKWYKPWEMLGNPNYSREQAKEAMNITNQFGWSGTQQDMAADMMQKYTMRYKGAIGQEQVMQLMEPTLRFGTASKSEVDNALSGMAEAARAAHMNLSQFAETVMTTGMSLAKSSGMTFPQSVNALNAYSMVTGQSPEAGAAIMGDERWQKLAWARTGDPYEAYHGKNAGVLSVEASLSLVPSHFKSTELWKQLFKKGNEGQLHQARKTLTIMEKSGMLGGMTEPMFENYMKRQAATGVDPVEAMKSAQNLDAALESGNVKGMKKAMRGLGGQKLLDDFNVAWSMGTKGVSGTELPDDIKEYYERLSNDEELSAGETKALKKWEKKQGYAGYIEKVLGGSINNDDDARNLTKRMAGDLWGAAGDTAAAEGDKAYTIDVKAPYGDMFKVMLKKGGNKSQSNSSKFFPGQSSGDDEGGGGGHWNDWANRNNAKAAGKIAGNALLSKFGMGGVIK